MIMEYFGDMRRSRARFLSFTLTLRLGAAPAAANIPEKSPVQSLSPDVRLLMARAQDAIKHDDLRIATLLLKNAAQAAPRNAAIQTQLGNVLVMQGLMVLAEPILRPARLPG